MESPHHTKSSHKLIYFVRWTVLVTLLVYACLTAVETYKLSTTDSYSILVFRTSALVQNTVKKLWPEQSRRELPQKDDDHPAGGAKVAGSGTKESGFRMKLLHRNSAESPFKKEYDTKGDALREDMHIDQMRLAAFRQRVFRAFHNSELEMENADYANGPASTAVVESPNISPSSEYAFQTPLVSGSTLGSGQYFVDFCFGTPPQKFSLIVDTGSDLIWVQCAPCKQCYQQTGPLYIPGNSSTFNPVPCLSEECLLIPAILGLPCDFRYPGACAYEYQYADSSSTKGVFAYETVTIGSNSNSSIEIGKVAMGCGTDNQGSFAAAGGVIGLGQGPLSFTSQIGYAYGNKFSYCLVNYMEPTSVSSSLVFGNESVLQASHTPLQYTPIVTNRHSPTLFYIQVLKVRVADQTLPIPSSAWSIDLMGDGGSVVDSGTTLTYFVWSAYTVILDAFQKVIPYPRVAPVQTLDLCFNVSGVINPRYPSFAIMLEGDVLLTLPDDNTFVDVAPDVKCLGMQGLQTPFGFNTFGNLMQQNFLVVYDRDKSRIGFTRTECSKL